MLSRQERLLPSAPRTDNDLLLISKDFGASRVLQQRIASYMPRPVDSSGPHILAKTDASVFPSVHIKTLGVRDCHFEALPALQGARSPLRPAGCSAYA